MEQSINIIIMKPYKHYKPKREEDLILCFPLDNTPYKQLKNSVIIESEVFKCRSTDDCDFIYVELSTDFYLDLLLYKEEFNTFTELYFSYDFVDDYNKVIYKEKPMYLDRGRLNGTDINGEFKFIREV